MPNIHRRLTLAAVLALGLTACGENGTTDETASEAPTESVQASPTDDAAATEQPTATAGETATGTLSVPVGEVIAAPEAFLEGEIAVTGQVEEELDDDNAFTVTGEDASEPLLVVNDGDVVLQEIDPGDRVLVEGVFVEFDASAMADAGAEVSPDDEALSGYDGDYVLIATSVEETEE